MSNKGSDILESQSIQFANTFIRLFNICPREHISEMAIDNFRRELAEKFKRNHQYLDSKFLSTVLNGNSNQAISSLWELVIIDKITTSQFCKSVSHRDDGPDWEITLCDGNKYFVEATCSVLPTNPNDSEVHRVIEEMREIKISSFGNELIAEVKSRISNSIIEKIKKHGSFIKNYEGSVGYILCISYGHLPFYASCDLYHAVQTVIPVGDLSITIPDNKQALLYQDSYLKLNGASINTHIFGNNNYNWISAILFSKCEIIYLLEGSENLIEQNWSGIKNDFVLVLNPNANYPLSEDIFGSASRITMLNDQIKNDGRRIFPSML